MSSYPPSPWRLAAHAYVGLHLVPKNRLDSPDSAATTPITFFGRGIVATAWFVYEPPSPLTYNEIMAVMLVRNRWRPLLSITKIWVDSTASRDGGRELWGIPKELADFTVLPHHDYAATTAGTAIGALHVDRVRWLPFSLPLGFSCGQNRDGLLVTPVRGKGRVGLLRGRWAFDRAGPLGGLAGRKPVLSLAIWPLRLNFGRQQKP